MADLEMWSQWNVPLESGVGVGILLPLAGL